MVGFMTLHGAVWADVLEGEVYLNQWAVEIHGGSGVADDIAMQYGFKNLGQVEFSSFFCFLFVSH